MQEGTNFIALAIPVFFLAMGAEILAARLMGRRVYRFPDAATDLACGISSQVVGVFLKFAVVGGYVVIYDAVWMREGTSASPLAAYPLWAWIAGLVGVDVLYYFWHRASHRVNLLWAAHIVHHHSEDYNLAVALRQALFTSLTAFPFYAVLAVAGVPPLVFFASHQISTLYQFWIHSELIPRLGPLELVLNTASHHRVHHAINPRYLDKNYAAILIIWDRMFGTFEPEGEPCVYGTVEPLRSYNPFWANFHHFVHVAHLARRAVRLADKVKIWFMPPAWRPEGTPALPPPPEVHPARFVKYDPRVPRGLMLYVAAQLVAASAATAALLMAGEGMSSAARLAAGALILATLGTWGGLFEHKRWAQPLELARLAAVLAFAGAMLAGTPAFPAAFAGIALVTAAFVVWVRRYAPRAEPAAARA